jgi:RNA polymerase sigma factor for flagellar operon FliA
MTARTLSFRRLSGVRARENEVIPKTTARHPGMSTQLAARAPAQSPVVPRGVTNARSAEQRVAEYLPMVRRMAYRLAARLPRSVQIDDIVQAGLIGLLDATTRFDEDRGKRFEAFASKRISGAMLDELRKNDWLPRRMRKSMRVMDRAMTTLEQRCGRTPTESELALEIGVSLTKYQAMRRDAMALRLVNMDDFEGAVLDEFLDCNCPGPANGPLQRLADGRLRLELIDAIARLAERDRQLMGMHYEQDLNFREIAAILHVSESRVCQLHTQIVQRLRAHFVRH